MRMESPLLIPGSFLPDHDSYLRPRLGRAGVASNFFLPPQSPSASTTLSQSVQSISRYQSSSEQPSARKRPRVDTADDVPRKTPHTEYHDDAQEASIFSLSTRPPSPAPLVNVNYRLAGGIDTPTAALAREEEEHQQHQDDFERDCRPSRYTVNQPTGIGDRCRPQTPGSTPDEGHKRRRPPSPLQSPKAGWGKTFWTLTGEVAGRVINFCWNSAFRGFYAGGGRGYHVDMGTPNVGASDWTEVNDVFHTEYQARRSTPLPGGFPDDGFTEDSISMRPQVYQQESTPTQHGDGGSAFNLKNSWVMVEDAYSWSREPSPVRKKARTSMATLHPRPAPSSRGSLGARPRLPVSRPSTGNASSASPRGPGTAALIHARRQSSDLCDHRSKRSRPSMVSARRSEANATLHTTPTSASPDVLKFERKLRRKEQREDESIRRLNQQMRDMIREAQQALGSKVEVDIDVDIDEDELDEDEGYEEGTALGVKGLKDWS